ncbi:hypothetical protein HPC63_01870 [Treponema phagedenis]|nr:hypothetical protein [Treponema phagedenis]
MMKYMKEQNKWRTLVLILFLFSTLPFFGQEKKDDNWVLAATEFSIQDLPELYKEYAITVPKMVLLYLDTDMRRTVPMDEKKARSLLETGQKKLKLIKERAALIKEKDTLFLSVESKAAKKKQLKKLEKDIKKKEQEIERAKENIKIADARQFSKEDIKTVSLWKTGSDLFNTEKHTNLAEKLQEQKISALVSGTLKDIAGYLSVSVSITTGLANMPQYHFSDAGKYEDIQEIVKNLSEQMQMVIQNAKPVTVYFDIEPKTASVYIQDKKIEDFSKPIILYKGSYTVSASATGFISATQDVQIKDDTLYSLKIALKKMTAKTVTFYIPKGQADIFFDTKYFGLTPFDVQLYGDKNLLDISHNGVRTFVLVNSKKIKDIRGSVPITASLNKITTKDKIEKQRKVLYWSLGAFYIALPIDMILRGVLADKRNAYESGRLPQTDKNASSIKALSISSNVMQGVTICLGVNYFIQLIRYLVAADQSLPKEAIPTENVPVQRKKTSSALVEKSDLQTDAKQDLSQQPSGGKTQ